MKCYQIVIDGRVQGVGFRWWTMTEARRFGVAGTVRNLPDGRVEVAVCGEETAVNGFIVALHSGPPYAHVTKVDLAETPQKEFRGFRIVH